jgi:PRTRC genetic system protein B
MKNKFELEHIIYLYSDGSNAYAESSKFQNGKVLNSKPLTHEALKKMFALSNESNRSKYTNGIIDPGVLSFSDRIEDKHVLWYRPAMQRSIATAAEVFNIWMPAMLFYDDDGSLSIYALKSDSRPNIRTPLYYAPIKNLLGKGTSFCWGNVNPDIKSTTINEIVREWEQYIWNSNFNNDGPSLIKSGDIYKLYGKLQMSQRKFPKSELINTKLTVQEILKK